MVNRLRNIVVLLKIPQREEVSLGVHHESLIHIIAFCVKLLPRVIY